MSGTSDGGMLHGKPACFECADGHCINPVLPIYDEDFEKPLSFLCDGYNHCADGTDERKGSPLWYKYYQTCSQHSSKKSLKITQILYEPSQFRRYVLEIVFALFISGIVPDQTS